MEGLDGLDVEGELLDDKMAEDQRDVETESIEVAELAWKSPFKRG